jgi:hypothetical protein
VASRSSCHLYDSMISEFSLILVGSLLRTCMECYIVVRVNRRNHAIVVTSGVGVVPRLRVIHRLPCIPRLVTGRLR